MDVQGLWKSALLARMAGAPVVSFSAARPARALLGRPRLDRRRPRPGRRPRRRPEREPSRPARTAGRGDGAGCPVPARGREPGRERVSRDSARQVRPLPPGRLARGEDVAGRKVRGARRAPRAGSRPLPRRLLGPRGRGPRRAPVRPAPEGPEDPAARLPRPRARRRAPASSSAATRGPFISPTPWASRPSPSSDPTRTGATFPSATVPTAAPRWVTIRRPRSKRSRARSRQECKRSMRSVAGPCPQPAVPSPRSVEEAGSTLSLSSRCCGLPRLFRPRRSRILRCSSARRCATR